jgi:hypothetical protein
VPMQPRRSKLAARPLNLGLAMLLCAAGCSGSDTGRRLRVGEEPAAGRGGGGAGGAGVGGGAGAGGAVSTAEALSLHVEDIDEMTIELITLACAGDCADVEAVANGGNPPYAFEWDDGSDDPRRRVCLTEDATLSVTATDTAISSEEFHYAAQTATSQLSATVLSCAGDAGLAPPDADAGAMDCTPIENWNVLPAECGSSPTITGRLSSAPLVAGKDYAIRIDSPGGFGQFRFDFYGSDDGCATTEELLSIMYTAGAPHDLCINATRDFEHLVVVQVALGVIAPVLTFSTCDQCAQ